MKYRSADITHYEIRQLVGEAKFILEIGANDGTDTLEMLKVFPEAMIACWECDNRAIEKWGNAVTSERAYLHTCALDETDGFKTFHASSGSPYFDKPDYDWDKSGSLLEPTEHKRISPWCKFEHSYNVPCMRLDSFFPQRVDNWKPSVDLIRIDVQGAELRVFRGGLETLTRTRYVLAECHIQEMYKGAPSQTEMLEFMATIGFECLGRYSNDLLFKGSYDAD